MDELICNIISGKFSVWILYVYMWRSRWRCRVFSMDKGHMKMIFPFSPMSDSSMTSEYSPRLMCLTHVYSFPQTSSQASAGVS